MRISKRALLWLLPAVLYGAFWAWYTDLRGPLTATEIDDFVGRMGAAGASGERIARLRQFMEEDTGSQFLMVNLLDMADAPPAVPGAPPDATADDLMDHYMEHMYPALFSRACHPAFLGRVVFDAMDLAGVEGVERWQSAALMRYRSRRDLVEIAMNPVFDERHAYKLAALDKTIAFPVEPVIYPGDLRLLLALLLIAGVALTDVLLFGRQRRA